MRVVRPSPSLHSCREQWAEETNEGPCLLAVLSVRRLWLWLHCLCVVPGETLLGPSIKFDPPREEAARYGTVGHLESV